MLARKIMLWSCAFLFLATPVVAYQFWDELLQMAGLETVPADSVSQISLYVSPKMQEHVESLQNQSLDETFALLLDGQQYFMYVPPAGNRTEDIHRILSTRIFLKVFQEFSALPREQALEKLHQFSERAIKEYENALGLSAMGIAAQKEDPSLSIQEVFSKVTGEFSLRGAKYMLCTTMLMAAKIGEYELLLHMIDTMQSRTDEYLASMGEGRHTINRLIASLEDDCLFTVLMYALEQKEGGLEDVDVAPFFISTDSSLQADEDILMKQELMDAAIALHPAYFRLRTEPVSLCRWDASRTQYDVGTPNPDDVVGDITVYRFASPWVGGSGREDDPQIVIDEQMQSVLDALKERLAT